MESWQGQTLGTNAPQPGDSSTKLGAGGPVGSNGSELGSHPQGYSDNYKLPVIDTERERRNFKGVLKGQMYNMKDYQTTTTEGVTTYWKESLSGMKTPPHG